MKVLRQQRVNCALALDVCLRECPVDRVALDGSTGLANSECNAIWVGSVTAATPGRRNSRLGTPGRFFFIAGEWFRTLSPVEPVVVLVMSFGAQNAIQGAEFAGALARYF